MYGCMYIWHLRFDKREVNFGHLRFDKGEVIINGVFTGCYQVDGPGKNLVSRVIVVKIGITVVKIINRVLLL